MAVHPIRFIGRLDAGYRADLVLLDANPLLDIGNVRRIRVVIQDGRVIDRAALLEATEVR
jgi:imidazolonepropionase-like amidohydrolase